jgi:geranylgeranyl pyrophosphate synthase
MLNHKMNTQIQDQSYLSLSWSDTIKEELSLVERRLLEKQPGQNPLLHATIKGLFDAGGKRVRPSLCILTAKLFKADINQTVSLAASVEMLHTGTLVHDDLIDGSLIRRGSPTLNSLWSSDIAVLVGDYMFARAASLVAEVEIIPVMKLFSKTLEIILNGEITQKYSKWEIDRQAYNERIFSKTAALFVLATQSVSMLAGARESDQTSMIKFGHNIGMAFQIVDDVLDYVGMSEKVGKPLGSDLSQGIFTLPAILFAENHPNDDDINTLIMTKEADPSIIQRLIYKITNSGAIEESLTEAMDLLNFAKDELSFLPSSIYKDSILDLAEQLVVRDM